jgi:iron complex outermembrane receptor protein
MATKHSQFKPNSNTTQKIENARVCRSERTVLAQAVSFALITGAASGPLLAQELALDEIIVTATKRAESVMDVPLAITAMSGDFIREVNLDDVKDLIAFTPGITGNTKDSFMDFVSVRGIRTIDYGNGGDPSISIFKNGLYQGRTGSGVVSLYDLERAEILRGPQGFMFGRNSVSGAMNIITAKPNTQQTEGYVALNVGDRGVLNFEGAVNFPVNENFALRLSGYHSEEDGYVPNLQGGPDLIAHEKDAFRVSARYETGSVTTDFFAEYEDRNQTGTVYRATGEGDSFNVVATRINGGVPVEVSPDPLTVNVDNTLGSYDRGQIFATGLQIDVDTAIGTFTSLTGFKDHDYQYAEDYDALPVVLFDYGQDQTGDYFEQEFRLTSDSDGPLSWYAGVSMYQENIDTTFIGVQEEDAYCGAYWYYNNEYYGAAQTCENTFYYYNYLDAYNGDTYYCDYYLDYYFGSCNWTSSPDGMIYDRNQIIGKYKGYSAYVDLAYQFNDSFDMSFGIRYNYDEKDFSQESLADPGDSILSHHVQTGFKTLNGPVRDKKDWSDTTYRVVANWHLNDSSVVFGSVTTGYKPGGFGSFAITQTDIANQPSGAAVWGEYIAGPDDKPVSFEPETVTSFDLGYKATVADGRAQISLNAFFYDYEDLQAIYYEGARVIVDNIGQVDGRGLEVDISTALSDNFTLRIGGSWLDTEAFDIEPFCAEGERVTGDVTVCDGNSIPYAPEYTAFAVLNASFPTANGEVFGILAWTWEDDRRGDWPDPSIVFQNIVGINQTDITVGYRTDTWRLAGYVENVFDDVWYDANYEDSDPADPYVQHNFGPARPLTAGLRFSYNF